VHLDQATDCNRGTLCRDLRGFSTIAPNLVYVAASTVRLTSSSWYKADYVMQSTKPS
jgi:hypothetical protein